MKDEADHKRQIASRHAIESFLESRRIALIGVSRDPKSYSRGVMKQLQKRGYQIIPINPRAKEIDGDVCFSSLEMLPEVVDGVLAILPPEKSDQVVRECLHHGIRRIWIRGNEAKSSVNPEIAQICRDNNITLIDGLCPLMFLDHNGFPHSLHGLIARWVGYAPK